MQAVAHDAAAHAAHPEPTTFWRKYVFSVDHKVIGKQYMAVSMFMALFGGLTALLVRWQLAYPEQPVPGLGWVPEPTMFEGVVPPEFYNALITMHGTLMVFFVAMPFLLGAFGNYLIPLMVGAPDMAFPRLNMMSIWTLIPASLIMLASFFVPGGAAAAGWTSYAPLSADATFTGVNWGINLWIIGLAMEFASFLMGGVNFMVTAINMRAPGLTLSRLPLLVWMQMTAAVLFMLSVGPLIAGAVMLLFDRTIGTSFFLPAKGGDALLWQHLFWFFGHPEVYVVLLPGFGILLEIFPTFTRKPVFGYRTMIYATIATGALSFIVWAHHMFVSGIDPRLATPFSITTIMISVPFAVMVFAMIASLIGGQMILATPMLFSLGFLTTFIIGGVTGIFLGAASVDIYLHGTYFVVAHFHYTLFPSVFLGGFAGIYYWYPKMFGRMMNETLGKIHFWITVITFNMVFIPLFFVGVQGHPRRVYTGSYYEFLKDTAGMHEFATMAAIVLAAAQIVFFINFFWSMRSGKPAGDNPWNSNSLEWATSSPPPHINFDTIPTVYRDPYEYATPGMQEDHLPQWVPAPAPRGVR